MNDPKVLTSYVNDFRRHLSPYLRPGVGLAAEIIPSGSNGAAIAFYFRPATTVRDEIRQEVPSPAAYLGSISQSFIGGDLSKVQFSGTNYFLDPKRILIIKGAELESEWSADAAKTDVARLLERSKGGPK